MKHALPSLPLMVICIFISTFTTAFFDVVIVCHHKDYGTLPHCVASIRKNIVDTKHIYVIGTQEISGDFIFVPENKFYQFCDPKKLRVAWNIKNSSLSYRAGWVFQQLVKLGAQYIIDDLSENYLCVDADIIWTRPQRFFNEQGQVRYAKTHTGCLCCCKKLPCHAPYKDFYQTILGEEPIALRYVSFIEHHMMFNKTILQELFAYIQKKHNKFWVQAFIDSLDMDQNSCMSEYELYGNWVWQHYVHTMYTAKLVYGDIHTLHDLKSNIADHDLVGMHIQDLPNNIA